MEPTDVSISTEWLANNIDQPNVLPLDCRVRRVIHRSGPSTFESCHEEWTNSRIPNSGYLHMVDDLSDAENSLPFMLPSHKQIALVLGRYGATNNTRLIVYGEAGEMSVHRCWWVLKAFGHPHVSVLDGGFRRWRSENRRVASGPATFVDRTYVPGGTSTRIATREDVRNAMSDPGVCLINALPEDVFRGEGKQVFGRPGHIPTSINISSESLIDPDTGMLLPKDKLDEAFNSQLPDGTKEIIPYCGGGIAASTLAFALSAAGYNNIRLYDGSLFDWTQEPDAPMKLGNN